MGISLVELYHLYKLLGRVPIPHADQDFVVQVSKKMKEELRQHGYPV